MGIDIGGTAIKYGVVDTATGSLAGPLEQLPTPGTPAAVARALREIADGIQSRKPAPPPQSPVGVAFPAIICRGTARSAANISTLWLGLDVNAFLGAALERPVQAVNDADAAALAEASLGAGRGREGTVLLLTLGTGIGSALVAGGKLVPNLELGHVELGGRKAEAATSAVAREREGLDWPAYAARLQDYLAHLEFLFSPELIILGGGISVRHQEFLPRLRLDTPVVPARLHNTAGVVGAVLAAA
nr:ROK family protein [Paeniglutamicibacter psychrophenolicus]